MHFSFGRWLMAATAEYQYSNSRPIGRHEILLPLCRAVDTILNNYSKQT